MSQKCSQQFVIIAKLAAKTHSVFTGINQVLNYGRHFNFKQFCIKPRGNIQLMWKDPEAGTRCQSEAGDLGRTQRPEGENSERRGTRAERHHGQQHDGAQVTSSSSMNHIMCNKSGGMKSLPTVPSCGPTSASGTMTPMTSAGSK